jgi:large subunit ribosomal protein L30
VSETDARMIRIKWVRSGIGFTRHQKTIVRSLGLSKLNRTVVRPDTPQIRGIVAAVPHLLEIVAEPSVPAWASIPEYSIHQPVAELVTPAETAPVTRVERMDEPQSRVPAAEEKVSQAADEAGGTNEPGLKLAAPELPETSKVDSSAPNRDGESLRGTDNPVQESKP